MTRTTSAGGDELTATEDILWRSLGRAVHMLPRRLDADMVKETGLSMTEYAVLSSLAAADGHRLRLVDLAAATGFSPSRVSRVADALARHDWITKEKSHGDARTAMATLTPAGATREREARRQTAAIARRHVLDLIDESDQHAVSRAMQQIADAP